MTKALDITGKRFSRLSVLKRVENNAKGSSMFLCKCDCGVEKALEGSRLNRSKVVSCGCFRLERCIEVTKELNKTHGMHGTKFYNVYQGIKQRAGRKKHYLNVENKWSSFEDFKSEMYESYLEYQRLNKDSRPTIERIDNNGHYHKGNCKWASYDEQSNNRSTNRIIKFNGEEKTLAQWAKSIGLKRDALAVRIDRLKWPLSKALTPQKYNRWDNHARLNRIT